MEQNQYQIAPPGFTHEQWQYFDKHGFLILENAIEPDVVKTLISAIDRVASAHPKFAQDRYFGIKRIVESDPVFADLIDHPRHIGYMYDLYGELLKLHLSEMFVRPFGSKTTEWHTDGAKVVPYRIFSPRLPLQTRVGYWLTDVTTQDQGALVVVPGSHRRQYLDQYTTHEPNPEEVPVLLPAGSITLHHCDLWHRVETNSSDTVRKNLYLSYCPSWITSADRHRSDPSWLATLTREQRIIMRDYDEPYQYAKPPAEEFPLFLTRDSGEDRIAGLYRDEVPLYLRHRPTLASQWTKEL
jgi:ectoine hydroxylase-related dioxygenase (phytanoyl-CoA dioxygenase family)